MHQLLKAVAEHSASDLLLTTGAPPGLRIDGEIIPLKALPLTPEDIKPLVFTVLNEAQKAKWEKDRALRISFGVRGLSRYRMTVYEQRGAMSATLKVVPFKLPKLDPAVKKMTEWLKKPGGLYLIAGNADSGRTWTLSALMDWVLINESVKIAIAHDPIEILLPHKNSYVEQFEAGMDFQTPEQGAERLIGASGDVLGWDFPVNHGASLLTLAQSGKRVIATMMAANADQAIAEIDRIAPSAKPLIRSVAYLELSPPAKGKPRELKAKFL